ncbi:unnamed protein product [Gordionus sp. m RMFG-2023]
MKEAFLIFDRKGDDKIGTSDVGNLLRSLGLVPTEVAVKKVGGTDLASERRITFEEFLPMFEEASKIKDAGSYEDFIEIMKVYDKEGDGTILAAEIRHVLLALGERLKENEVDEILQGKENSDGYIEYERKIFIKFF